jgi:hypothetical protein
MPSKTKTIPTTVLLPGDLHKELKLLAFEQERRMSSQIVFMLRKLLKQDPALRQWNKGDEQ